jgi:hypothetical protein
MRVLHFCENNAPPGSCSSGQIVQMPLQRVVERDALTDQALAVIDEQPQVKLGPVEVSDREGLQPFAQRGPRDVQSCCRASTLPLLRLPSTATPHSAPAADRCSRLRAGSPRAAA